MDVRSLPSLPMHLCLPIFGGTCSLVQETLHDQHTSTVEFIGWPLGLRLSLQCHVGVAFDSYVDIWRTGLRKQDASKGCQIAPPHGPLEMDPFICFLVRPWRLFLHGFRAGRLDKGWYCPWYLGQCSTFEVPSSRLGKTKSLLISVLEKVFFWEDELF